MYLRWLVSKRFLKAFVKASLEVAGIPSTILVVLYLLGLKVDAEQTQTVTDTLQPFGPVIIVLFVLGVGLETAYKIVKEDREDYDKRFYEFNSQARLERAHFVLCQLSTIGKVYQKGTQQHRNEWDSRVQSALNEYCGPDALNSFLINTKRFQPGTELNPLTLEVFQEALGFVDDLIRNDFAPHGVKH
jgi:hypothetical protein